MRACVTLHPAVDATLTECKSLCGDAFLPSDASPDVFFGYILFLTDLLICFPAVSEWLQAIHTFLLSIPQEIFICLCVIEKFHVHLRTDSM
jgi:hypothetical protein